MVFLKRVCYYNRSQNEKSKMCIRPVEYSTLSSANSVSIDYGMNCVFHSYLHAIKEVLGVL